MHTVFFSALLKWTPLYLDWDHGCSLEYWPTCAAVIVFSRCFGDQRLFLIILVTIINYFYFFNYNMSSCKFYHDCILAPKKCKKQTNKQKNWLDTLTSKEKWDQLITQWESHKSGQLLSSVPWNKLKCIWQSLLLQPLKMSQQLAVLPLDIPVKSFFCCLLNTRFKKIKKSPHKCRPL